MNLPQNNQIYINNNQIVSVMNCTDKKGAIGNGINIMQWICFYTGRSPPTHCSKHLWKKLIVFILKMIKRQKIKICLLSKMSVIFRTLVI